MAAIYNMIKTLPAKGFDWTGLRAALRSEYVALAGRNVASWSAQRALREFDEVKGLREIRTQTTYMAVSIVSDKSRRSNIIPPSEESRMWDSFEGGHHDVWTDAAAEEAATAEIANLVKTFTKVAA